jgi:Tol biopolymer transport system component
MRSGGLLLRVRAALRPAVGRVLAAALVAALVVPASAAAGTSAPAARQGIRAPFAAPLPAPSGVTTLISKDRRGGWANNGSIEPVMSASGRWVAFTSRASDLVAGDGNDLLDVFLRDLRTGRTIRVPPPRELPAGGESSEPAISGDGTVVAYTYLVAPTGAFATVAPAPTTFVVAYDRTTGRSEVVSRTRQDLPAGRSGQASVSETGRYVAFTSSTDITGEDDSGLDVFRFDRRTRTSVLLSSNPDRRPISGNARQPSISGDGNLVAFVSNGGDSVTFENTGKGDQVYVRDVRAQRTTFISRGTDGKPPRGQADDPALSGNGRYVVFASDSSNLVTTGPEGGPGVFRHDLATGATILVSVTPDGGVAEGTSGQASVTEDGRMVAFTSTALDLAPVAAVTAHLAILVEFVPTDVYLRDIDAGETILISVTADGTASRDGNSRSFQPSVAGGGRYVAFGSNSDRIREGDPNETYDVFLRDLPPVPVLTPATLDLGAGAVGTSSAPGAATLANAGWSPLTVTKATITGGDKGDFKLVADACSGRQLRRNDACTVSVIFAPTARGTRTATLAIADTHTGSPRTVRLRGTASQAKLRISPEIGPPGIVTIATGTGFPPGATVRLRWTEGMTPTMQDVVADERGRFSTQVLVFHNDRTGPRDLVAESATGTGFPPASAEMLVVKPSAVPPTFAPLRVVDLPIVLVIRG